MVLSILQMVLPVIITFLLGTFCRRKNILSEEGLGGLRKIVSNILLPVVLFNAFFTAEYSGKILLTFVTVYLSCSLALLLGFLLRRFVKPYGKFMPFLVTDFEGGMLGYALFGLLVASGTHIFAMVDIGQTLCAYTVYMVTLTAVSGGKAQPKEIAKSALTNPAFIGTLFGVITGALGLGKIILSSSVGLIVQDIISFITAPTSALILIIVGYDLSFRRELMRPVLITVTLRLVIMALLLGIGYVVLFHFIPFDKSLFTALLLAYSLPAPFIIPLFADIKGHGEYISTVLSIETIVTIVLFVGIAAYSLT